MFEGVKKKKMTTDYKQQVKESWKEGMLFRFFKWLSELNKKEKKK